MSKLPKGWKEEKIGSKQVLKKIYKYKESDTMDMINFAGDISELSGYETNIDFNFGDQKGVALVFDKKTNKITNIDINLSNKIEELSKKYKVS